MSIVKHGLSCAVAAIAIVAAATPTFAITLEPHASCQIRNAPATVPSPVLAEWPDMGYHPGATGTAVVRVDLRADGTVRDAAIVSSAGDWGLDRAARGSTMQQRYVSEIRECQPVEGSYLVEVAYH